MPSHLLDNLRKEREEQKEPLSRKLNVSSESSAWRTSGRKDIVTNLSSKQLTYTEKEALSLGLELDTGSDSLSYREYVSQNYRWDEN